MKTRLKIPPILITLLLYLCWVTPAHASDVASATKDCLGGPCTTTSSGSFSISYTQTVKWEATYTGSGTQGNDFYLSTSGPNGNEIVLHSSLSGSNSGTRLLNPGTYYIGISNFGMGPGSYSVEYDIAATISVSPLTWDFGTKLTGSATTSKSFSISRSGDAIPVSITSIVAQAGSSPNFTVSSIPSSAPGSFTISFNTAGSAGAKTATFVINATATGGVVNSPLTVSVSGVLNDPIPNAECVGGGCGSIAATADYVGGGHADFNKSFRNSGTANLAITSITLNSSTGEFALIGSPSLATLTPGQSRPVAIRYTPTSGEHTSCAMLVIHTNDPDQPVLQCEFGARAHHPEPRIRIVETTLDYHDVEIGFSFKKAITIFNDGDAPLHVTVTNTSSSSPDMAQWESVSVGSATVPPGTTPAFFDAIFKPGTLSASGTSYELAMTVGHDDPTASTPIAVRLTGRGIAPIPMDNVLVLDRSGSMSESLGGASDKIHGLRSAASLYLDLLRDETGSGTGDKIGFVNYNHTNGELLPIDFKTSAHLTLAQSNLTDAALADPAKLQPTGNTGIGSAMQRGANMLVGSPADRKHIMVVMSDGIQTATPLIANVIDGIHTADPDLKIYSLGLGDDAHIDGPALQSITNVANGFHQVSDNLAGTALYSIEEFYFKIFSNANGMSLVVDPAKVVQINTVAPIEVSHADIVSSDRYAAFLVLDDPQLRAYYNLELVSPTGNVMTLGAAVAGIPIQYFERFNYKIYKVIFPDISQSSSYVGTWVLRLTPNGKWDSKKVASVARAYIASHNGNVQPQLGQAPVSFMAAVKSDYAMNVNVSYSTTEPGADLTITAALTDRGWPSSGNVNVDVTRPDHSVVANIVMRDDGTGGDAVAHDGIYTTHYTQTSWEGSYKFFYHAIGKNERGELVPREDTRYVGLYRKHKDDPRNPGDKPCLPCWINWIMVVLLILILLLLIRKFRNG